ncbi:AhpA/YtjB family protein [Escherichia coli]
MKSGRPGASGHAERYTLMRTDSPDEKRIQAILNKLTIESRILDAGVYDEQGNVLAR